MILLSFKLRWRKRGCKKAQPRGVARGGSLLGFLFYFSITLTVQVCLPVVNISLIKSLSPPPPKGKSWLRPCNPKVQMNSTPLISHAQNKQYISDCCNKSLLFRRQTSWFRNAVRLWAPSSVRAECLLHNK